MVQPGEELHGYRVPEWQCLQREAVFINTWSSQWDGQKHSEEERALIMNIRRWRGLQSIELCLRLTEEPLTGIALQGQGPGPPLLTPTASVCTLKDGLFQDLLDATDRPEGIMGWTPRGFSSRKGDAHLLAILSRVPLKPVAHHLYKRARLVCKPDYRLWGPFSTIAVVADTWPKYASWAGPMNAAYSVWIVLQGGLELGLLHRSPVYCPAGTLVASDWLLRGGQVCRVLEGTRVLWGTTPLFAATHSPQPGRLNRAKPLCTQVRVYKASGRRKRSRQHDPRRHNKLGDPNGVMAAILACSWTWSALKCSTCRIRQMGKLCIGSH